jgi:protein subunit release factor A
VIGDANQFRRFSREFAQLEPVAHALHAEAQARRDLAAAEAMRGDVELRELAEEEIASATERLERLDAELLAHLIPKDARDEGDIYLEVRAGTGGDEAAIFAAICSACIRAMRSGRAGRSRSNPRARANTAATRKSSPASKAGARIRG